RFDSKYLKVLASCISVLMTMVFLAMQYVGNARAMNIVSGDAISYPAAILISVAFSLLYVLIGGAGGVVLLDAIQAVILLVGIVVA
ncbi:sodium:solute symporter family transporter, partial [Streptomyces brasiliscabiei]